MKNIVFLLLVLVPVLAFGQHRIPKRAYERLSQVQRDSIDREQIKADGLRLFKAKAFALTGSELVILNDSLVVIAPKEGKITVIFTLLEREKIPFMIEITRVKDRQYAGTFTLCNHSKPISIDFEREEVYRDWYILRSANLVLYLKPQETTLAEK